MYFFVHKGAEEKLGDAAWTWLTCAPTHPARWSNTTFLLEVCFYPPDERKSNIHSLFTLNALHLRGNIFSRHIIYFRH